MRVVGKDRNGCDACNPLDEIIARIEQLERRVVTIVARVQGIPPDGTGNVTLPTSDSVDGPLYGNIGAFAMSSEVKEATEDVHQYASAIADDVVVLQSDVEILTREVAALDPASVTALQQSVAALQQSVTQLSNTVAGYSAVIGDLEDQMPNKVDRTGDTMTGPLNVIDTATGSRNAQAVNGNRLQKDLDNYAPMIRTTGNQTKSGQISFASNRPIQSAIRGGWGLIRANQQALPEGTLNYTMMEETDPDGITILHVRFQAGVNNEISRMYFTLSHVIDGVKKYADYIFEDGPVSTRFYITRQCADGSTKSVDLARINESD